MALPETFEWSQLTSDQSEILEAYFALSQEREPTSIGSGEILQWFRDRLLDVNYIGCRLTPATRRRSALQREQRGHHRVPPSDHRAPADPPRTHVTARVASVLLPAVTERVS